MAIKVIGTLDKMPETKRRGRADELGPFVEEHLLPKDVSKPGPIVQIEANAGTATNLKNRFGVDARSYTSTEPDNDEKGNQKTNPDGSPKFKVYVAAQWPGQAKAEATMEAAQARKDKRGDKAANPVISSGKR